MNAFYYETDPENSYYVLHLLHIFVLEDTGRTPGLAPFCVFEILEKLLLSTTWADEVPIYAFKMLAAMNPYCNQMESSGLRNVVQKLCDYINMLLLATGFADNVTRIVAATDCMLSWILASQWIFSEPECLKLVLRTLGINLLRIDRGDDSLALGKGQNSAKNLRKIHASVKGKKKNSVPPNQKTPSTLKEVSEIGKGGALS